MRLRTWSVYLGEFKLGDIIHVDGGMFAIKASSHQVEEVRGNRYDSFPGAVNFYRMSVPSEARHCLKFLEQPVKEVGEKKEPIG
jgi:hypothetical protein